LDFHIYFWASLSVGGTAGASASIAIDRGLGEQTLALLYSFVSKNRSNLCTMGILAILVGVYLASINFN